MLICPLVIRSVAVTAVAATALTGCSSGGEDSGPGPAAKPTKQSAAPKERLPLTGQLVSNAPDRGALVVKMDNTEKSRPQVGFGAADLVVEELVEGGLTRLAVFYQSKAPSTVEPVRSMRTSDIAIVSPVDGLLAASGAARRTIRAVEGANVRTATPDNAKGFSRDPQRPAPYNLVLRPESLTSQLDKFGTPGDYLPWAKPGAPAPAGSPVRSAVVKFSPFHTTRWTYAGGEWRRDNELARSSSRFRPTTLLILRVRTKDAGYRDPAGNPVPETVLRGSGAATLLYRGKATQARWSKGDAGAPLTLTTTAGRPLQVPPGHTWIELAPRDGQVTLRR